MQGKKFISPQAWFSFVYPSDWNEFEDKEDTFLFYNPNKWTGNFRISAYKCELERPESMTFAEDEIRNEHRLIPSAELTEKDGWISLYFVESSQENGDYYTTHIWMFGKKNILFNSSFTVPRGGNKSAAEAILSTLELHEDGMKQFKEIIPIRVLEINEINEAYEWVSSTVKKMLKKDFTASDEDIVKIQQLMETGQFNPRQKEVWQWFGIAFGTILINEIDGMEWVTVIDGSQEYPALRYKDSDIIVYPMQLIWEKRKDDRICNLREEYELLRNKIEDTL